MNIQNSRYPDRQQHPQPQPEGGCKDCKDAADKPSQLVINKERNTYCLALYESKGATSQQETKFDGEKKVYNAKKCLFNNTEDNYRRYRNLEITVGSEMLQTTESIKSNVDKLKKWNSDLNGLLKKLNKSLKDAKAKFGELKDSGCKLKSSIKDKCNAAQWKALTGKTSEHCRDTNPSEPIPACKEAEDIFDDLICYPEGLNLDIDSLFQASADVVGIQIFSNIDILEPLQKDLDTYGKDFEKHLSEVMKARESDLKKLQEELIKSVRDITKSAMDRNSLRADFEGYRVAVQYMCCPSCDCIHPEDNNGDCDDREGKNRQSNHRHENDRDCEECKPRLKDCEKAICDICKEVDDAFCCPPEVEEEEPKPKPTEYAR